MSQSQLPFGQPAMNEISNPKELSRWQKSVAEMILHNGDFHPEWIKKHGWKVVPAEDTGHFSPREITTLVAALQGAGYERCIAIATESVEPDGVPGYTLSISAEEFQNFNTQRGVFRYGLTDAKRSWAISCNEWYNLFAGKPELLESMLGKTIAAARKDFLGFATLIAKRPDEPVLRVAKHYAELP
jgi:hypothetical protein